MGPNETPPGGLSEEEAQRRLAVHGPNRIETRPRLLWPRLLARQFANPMAALLGVAAMVALAIGDRIDAAAIVAIALLNAALGFAQEWRAETALAALAALLAPTARVLRGGAERKIPAQDLVPGDLVLLEAGDATPADIELLPGAGVQLDESALTGESVPVDRAAGETALQGTLVLSGRARGVAAATGLATEFGRIAALARAAERGEPLLTTRPLSNPVLVAVVILVALVPLFALGWSPLSALLEADPPAAKDWALIAAFALPLLILPEAVKLARAALRPRRGAEAAT